MHIAWGLSATLLAFGLWSAACADELGHQALLHDQVSSSETPAAAIPSTLDPHHPGPTRRARRTLTVVIGGDLGLNAHGQRAESDGARRHGVFLPWDEMTAGLRPLIDGDLNFANLETVVTHRNDLPPEPKAFNFRSHPVGVRHLARIGFNLFSTANNHAVDYGVHGLVETLSHLDELVSQGLVLGHAGVGATRDAASRPKTLSVKGAGIAFSALGIDSGGRAGHDRPGVMAWRAPEDVAAVIQALGDATADYRILSVHHGQERRVETDREAIVKLRQQAVLAGGIDLVAGHHAHVVQGVEIMDGRLIFYGLGNLMHPGMQNMSGFGICQDYGLLARIHLAGEENGRLQLMAVEAIPLSDMHWIAGRMAAGPAAERVHVLNHLAEALDDRPSGARGLRFAPQTDGSGLHCEPGAAAQPGRVGALCTGFSGAPPTPGPLKARIVAACSQGDLIAGRQKSVPGAKPRPTLAAQRTVSDWLRRAFTED